MQNLLETLIELLTDYAKAYEKDISKTGYEGTASEESKKKLLEVLVPTVAAAEQYVSNSDNTLIIKKSDLVATLTTSLQKLLDCVMLMDRVEDFELSKALDAAVDALSMSSYAKEQPKMLLIKDSIETWHVFNGKWVHLVQKMRELDGKIEYYVDDVLQQLEEV